MTLGGLHLTKGATVDRVCNIRYGHRSIDTACHTAVKQRRHQSASICQNGESTSGRNPGTCEPSTSSHNVSLADFGTRVTLERLYVLSENLHGIWEHNIQGMPAWASSTFMVTLDDKPQQKSNQEKTPDYFANVGDAIRNLRDDIPLLFQRDLNYEIYHEDVVFRDPRNCFKGIKNYQLIFWSLRFHGKLFFSKLTVDVKRIWQPDPDQIKMRWTVRGVPRVPWEAEGIFDGISTYKLDRNGRIYEHSVDNVLLRDPPMATNGPLLAGLNLIPQGSQQPYPGAWCKGQVAEPSFSTYFYSVSWFRMYIALVATVQMLAVPPSPAPAAE